MSKIKALLLDDEPLALLQLENYARRIEDLEVVASCSSAAQARAAAEQADVLFADISMPDISGLDFVRSLPDPPLVVFTTAHAGYAVEGFRVNAVDYLLKPFSFAEFQNAVARVRQRLEMEKAAAVTGGVIRFRTDYKTLSVALRDIRYIESMSEYVKVHLDSQEHPLVVLYSLKKLAAELPAGRFLRIHRSYIVPLARVSAFSAASATLDCGVTLPVGESYRPAWRAARKEGF